MVNFIFKVGPSDPVYMQFGLLTALLTSKIIDFIDCIPID